MSEIGDFEEIFEETSDNESNYYDEYEFLSSEDSFPMKCEPIDQSIYIKLINVEKAKPEIIANIAELQHVDIVKCIFSHLDTSDNFTDSLKLCMDEIEMKANDRPVVDALCKRNAATLRKCFADPFLTNEEKDYLVCVKTCADFLELEKHRIADPQAANSGDSFEEFKIISPKALQTDVDQVLVNEHLIVLCAYKTTVYHLRVHDRWNFKLVNALSVSGSIDKIYIDETEKEMAINCSTKYGHYQPIVWNLQTGRINSVFIVRNAGFDCIYCDTKFFAYVSHQSTIGHVLSVFKRNGKSEKLKIIENKPIAFGELEIDDFDVKYVHDFYLVLGFNKGQLRCCQLRSTSDFLLLNTVVYVLIQRQPFEFSKIPKPKVCLVGGLYLLVENLYDGTIEARSIHSSKPFHIFDMNVPDAKVLQLVNIIIKNDQLIAENVGGSLAIWKFPPDLLFDFQQHFLADDIGPTYVSHARFLVAPVPGTKSAYADEFGVLQFYSDSNSPENIVVRIFKNN